MRNLYSKSAVLIEKEKIKILNLKISEPKKNQVVVKVIYSGVCGSQFMEFKGLRGKDRYLPHLFGHEAVGKVLKIGSGVKGIKKNDRVILSWLKKHNNIREENGQIPYKNIHINYGPITTFSTITTVDSNRVYKLPKFIPLKDAVLFGCSIPTGIGVVINQAKPTKNSICVVYGIGAVGIFIMLALKALGVKKIIGIENNLKRIKFLNNLGFKNILNPENKNFNKKINFLLNNIRADYCFECTGIARNISNSMKLISNKGKLFFVSHPKFNENIKLKPYDLILGKKIYGSWGGSSNLQNDIKKFYQIIIKSKIKLSKLYKIVNFQKINDIFLSKKKFIQPKLVLKF